MCLFRHFLQDLPTTLNKYPALIKSHLEADGTLDKFTTLRSNSVDWNVVQQKWTVESSDLQWVFCPHLQKKTKRKTVDGGRSQETTQLTQTENFMHTCSIITSTTHIMHIDLQAKKIV